jgi:hypothetical protein
MIALASLYMAVVLPCVIVMVALAVRRDRRGAQ